VSRPTAGSIVVVDWRQEPSPAVVVEDDELFPEEYPNILVVPWTRIDPDDDNGAETTCWALAHHVTSVSPRRVNPTPSRITADQLSSIRRRITVAVGVA
jgi:mRNA interferase MazF